MRRAKFKGLKAWERHCEIADLNLIDKKVLVVEDNISDVLPIKTILEEIGCEVATEFDGRGAVEGLVKKSYDLVVLDWQMPDFNGGEALVLADRFLKEGSSKPLRKTPVVAYTGQDVDKICIPSTQNFEFIEYWKKPLDMLELAKRANVLF